MGVVALKREPVVVSKKLREEPWRSTAGLRAGDAFRDRAPPDRGQRAVEGDLNLESLEVNTFDNEDRYILQIQQFKP